ncbi:uncharacterized protein SMIM47 [Elephas maximus indicus]|nr:uncharacterized protein SMIM47 [Elephas maximus indicus]
MHHKDLPPELTEREPSPGARPHHHGHHSGLLDSQPSSSEAQEREREDKGLFCWRSMDMNFQENVTLALAVFTILASIYFFNKAQH